MKVKLIMVCAGRIESSKATFDIDKHLAVQYRGYWRFRKAEHTFEVDPKHLKTDPKGKTWILIDVNARKSIDLETAKELDAEKLNKLDYLTESAFWDSLNLRRRDILELLITLGAGIGLYSILRLVLSMYGYYLP